MTIHFPTTTGTDTHTGTGTGSGSGSDSDSGSGSVIVEDKEDEEICKPIDYNDDNRFLLLADDTMNSNKISSSSSSFQDEDENKADFRKCDNEVLLFSTQPHYSTFVRMMLVFVPLSICGHYLITITMGDDDENKIRTGITQKNDLIKFLLRLVPLLIFYCFYFPLRFDVILSMSHEINTNTNTNPANQILGQKTTKTLKVSTLVWTYFYDAVVGATRDTTIGSLCGGSVNGSGSDDDDDDDDDVRSNLLEPKIKFATTLLGSHRVCVRRGGKKWSVLVSPKDVEGFLQAIMNNNNNNKDDHDDHIVFDNVYDDNDPANTDGSSANTIV